MLRVWTSNSPHGTVRSLHLLLLSYLLERRGARLRALVTWERVRVAGGNVCCGEEAG